MEKFNEFTINLLQWFIGLIALKVIVELTRSFEMQVIFLVFWLFFSLFFCHSINVAWRWIFDTLGLENLTNSKALKFALFCSSMVVILILNYMILMTLDHQISGAVKTQMQSRSLELL